MIDKESSDAMDQQPDAVHHADSAGEPAAEHREPEPTPPVNGHAQVPAQGDEAQGDRTAQQRPVDSAGRRTHRHNGRRPSTPPPANGQLLGRAQGAPSEGGIRPTIPSSPLPPIQRSQPTLINPRPPRPRVERVEQRAEPRTEREPLQQLPVSLEKVSGYLVALNGSRFVLRNRTHLNTNTADVAVNPGMVRNYGLRSGDLIQGTARSPRGGERLAEMVQIETVNDGPPEAAKNRTRFDSLTPTFPDRQIVLERPGKLTGRVIDLMCPIGFGSRVLIVSPPKAGKTTVLKEIALAVSEHNPEAVLMLCLVGERPEEVTDLRTSVRSAEVISSTFDEAVEFHVELAELTIERAKRMVEMGKDVVLLLDSITRLTRAYNLSEAPQGEYRSSGRTLSGGIDASALYPPKRFFGAARACMEGGSLTVIASCLVDTGSRMEDVIYEELKGTGNSELVLDRHLAEERIFPAIDINRSSTRREELLLSDTVLPLVVRLRRALAPLNSTTASRFLLEQLANTPSNEAFVARVTGDRDWVRSVPRSNGDEDLGFGQRPGRY